MSTASGSSDDSKIRVRRAPLGQIWEAANALAAGQMPKQLSSSTRHSDISVELTNSVDYSSLIPLRDRLVDPDVSAASPSHRRSRPASPRGVHRPVVRSQLQSDILCAAANRSTCRSAAAADDLNQK
jgi:hypothetical protein